jgi:hypothetical protein
MAVFCDRIVGYKDVFHTPHQQKQTLESSLRMSEKNENPTRVQEIKQRDSEKLQGQLKIKGTDERLMRLSCLALATSVKVLESGLAGSGRIELCARVHIFALHQHQPPRWSQIIELRNQSENWTSPGSQ